MVLFSTASPSHVTAPRFPQRRGFSVVELLIVCGIVAIFVTLAYPRVDFAEFQVDSGARTVRTSLQNAERLAVTQRHDVVVSFDLVNKRLRILEDANDNGVVDGGERVSYVALENGVHFKAPPAGLSGPVSSAVTGSNMKTVDGMPTIVFHRDGAASTDLEVYLVSSKELPNDWRAIQVVQSTGHTDWYRYLDNLWKTESV
jgi:prepilin-type N-terminal cleavage/methylation domain-containing protein